MMPLTIWRISLGCPARESCGCRWAAACGGGYIKVIAALGLAV